MTDQPVTPDREALKLDRELGKVAQALRSQADISDRAGQWADLMNVAHRVEESRSLLTDALDRARQQGREEAAEAIEAHNPHFTISEIMHESYQTALDAAAAVARGGPNRKDEE